MKAETVFKLIKRCKILLFNERTLKGVLIFILIFFALLTDIWLAILSLATLVGVVFFKKGLRTKIYVLTAILFIALTSFLSDVTYDISRSYTLKDSTQLNYTYANKSFLWFHFLPHFLPKFLWPKPCSVALLYEIGIIDDEIQQGGLSGDKLLNAVKKAEIKWEEAIGANLFEHKSGVNSVRIDFLKGRSDDTGGATTSSYGLLGPEIHIIVYLEPKEMTLDFLEEKLGPVLLHEMGHAIGLPHLPREVNAIMSPSGYGLSDFSSADINLAEEFCSDRIISVSRSLRR